MMHLKVAAVAVWLVISCILIIVLTPLALLGLDLNRLMARIHGPLAMKLAGVELEIIGPERINSREVCVIVANHQSMFDFSLCCQIFAGRCVIVGKKELYFIPFFNLFFWLAGHIAINRQKRESSVQALGEAAQKMVKNRVSVWIFPEGTRNRQMQGLLKFKKGPFYLALKAGVPIRPVVFSSMASMLDFKNRRFRSGKVQVEILPLVSTAELNADHKEDIEVLSSRVREMMLQSLSRLRTQV